MAQMACTHSSLLGSNRGGVEGAFRDLHFGIMSTFVNVKIVRFAVIVNKDRNNNQHFKIKFDKKEE